MKNLEAVFISTIVEVPTRTPKAANVGIVWEFFEARIVACATPSQYIFAHFTTVRTPTTTQLANPNYHPTGPGNH